MTTITINRATVEHALEALERARPLKADYTTLGYFEEAKRKHYAAMAALRAALAQQEEPQDVELSAALGWPGGISNPVLDRKVLLQKVAALMQDKLWEDHRVRHLWDHTLAQQAEPVEPVAWVNVNHLQGLTLGLYGYVEIYTDESHGRIPLYTAPPQRKPLTDEEIIDATEHIDTSRNGYFIHIARAVERAHGITDPQVADRLARHGIPMPGDPK